MLIIFAGMFLFFCIIIFRGHFDVIPLVFLIISSLLNIVLDYLFVVPFQISVRHRTRNSNCQIVSAVGIAVYTLKCVPEMKFHGDVYH